MVVWRDLNGIVIGCQAQRRLPICPAPLTRYSKGEVGISDLPSAVSSVTGPNGERLPRGRDGRPVLMVGLTKD
jgi:hypothetical protein